MSLLSICIATCGACWASGRVAGQAASDTTRPTTAVHEYSDFFVTISASRADVEGLARPSAAGGAHQGLAPRRHVVERAEGHHVVAAVASALDTREHPAEVDRALAGAEVLLVSPVAVGHAHLAATAEIHGVEEAVDALGEDRKSTRLNSSHVAI